MLTGTAGAGEALAAQGVLEHGIGGGRLALLAGVAAAALLATVMTWQSSLAIGRRLERALRARLLERVARMGDHHVRSRPAGDLAERGHAIVLVRTTVELAALAVQRAAEVLVAAVAITILAPAAWPASIALLAVAGLAPALLARSLAEGDLRARTAQGALSLQVTDGLRAADALVAHRAAAVLNALHVPLLGLWSRAVRSVQARLAAATLAVEIVGLLLVVAAVALAVRGGAGQASALIVGVLAFLATAALQDLVFVARRAVPLRNALARVLER